MIRVRKLCKTFGSYRAVRGVSFEVPAGQVVGLLGPNGAGKTTTIRMIAGFLPADSGTATIAGFDVMDQSRRARSRIGYLPESAPLYPEMRVAEYLDHRGRLYRLPGKMRRRAAETAMRRCELEPVANRRIGHLSKGFRQRVGLAATMLHDPDVLILDEPTNGLDPKQILQARALIRELAQDRTVIVSSHILPEVERTCDRVIVMARGRILGDGSPDELARKHAGPAEYTLEVRPHTGPAEAPAEAVRPIPGVHAVETSEADDGWLRLRIGADAHAPDLREALATAVRDAGLPVREIGRARPSLEQVFAHLIETEPEDAGQGARS